MGRIVRMKRIAKIRRKRRINRVIDNLGRAAGEALRS